ncbi:hypothetical protein JJC04_15455 [Flavobacterium covae]|nr:hypothetical protein [Flavobacterium covae]QYS91151.1 hypothetical protein JJC04_15455 [Flavobacterium covae]
MNALTIELEREKEEKRKLKLEIKTNEKQTFVNSKLREWRKKSWYQLGLCIILIVLGIIYLFYLSNWQFDKLKTLIEECKTNSIVTGLSTFVIFIMTFFVLRNLREKYYNHSNIKAFKEMIELPEHLK